MAEVETAQNKNRGWGIKMAGDTVFNEVYSWTQHWDKQGIYRMPILVGDDNLMCQLAFAEEWPHNLTGITTFGLGDNISLSPRRVMVMGGDYPYKVILVDQPADYEDGRGMYLIKLSPEGARIYIQSLNEAPEHIKKAAELASGGS